jgi:hypothetical protein
MGRSIAKMQHRSTKREAGSANIRTRDQVASSLGMFEVFPNESQWAAPALDSWT